MRFFGLVIITIVTGTLSVDWYVCFIKKQCTFKNDVQIMQEAKAIVQPVHEVKTINKANSVEDKVKIINGRIHFKYGAKKFLSSKKVQKYLKEIASEWSKDPSKKILVYGHTDNRGSRKANYRLGLYRSKSIKKALALYGVDQSKIVVKSYGEVKPMSTNRTRKGRFFNRRVEISFK